MNARRRPIRLLATALLLAAPAVGQRVDEAGAEIHAEAWFNHIGALPTYEGLRGQTVLLHFFNTEKPASCNWAVMRKFLFDHRDKGLVVVAVSPEPPATIAAYIEKHDLPFTVGAGIDIRKPWLVYEDYYLVGVDRKGIVFHRGSTNSLWNGKLLKTIKGSERYGTRAVLRVAPAAEFGKRVAKIAGDLFDGELEKSIVALERLLEGTGTKEEDRADANALLGSVKAHLDLVAEQIEAQLARREAVSVRDALAALTKELGKHPLGQRFHDREEELSRDAEYLREIEATEAFDRLVDLYYRLGLEKNRRRFDGLIEEFEGTRAVERAEMLLRGQ